MEVKPAAATAETQSRLRTASNSGRTTHHKVSDAGERPLCRSSQPRGQEVKHEHSEHNDETDVGGPDERSGQPVDIVVSITLHVKKGDGRQRRSSKAKASYSTRGVANTKYAIILQTSDNSSRSHRTCKEDSLLSEGDRRIAMRALPLMLAATRFNQKFGSRNITAKHSYLLNAELKIRKFYS